MLRVDLLKALASDKRLQVLDWLRDPSAHFPPQDAGDLVRDGVCSQAIADKLGVSAATGGEHLKVLQRAGLVEATRVKQWTFYRRREDAIEAARRDLGSSW